MSTSPFLVVEDVARRYQVKPKTVREWARNGAIPHWRSAGTRRLQFRCDWLETWESGAELETVELARGGRVCRPVAARRAA
jgi:excisionase family DNA binding protein